MNSSDERRVSLTITPASAKHALVFALRRLRVPGALLLASSLLTACGATNAESAPRKRAEVDRPGLPLARAGAEELERFREGDSLFEVTVRESDGLGPLYVRDSCAACHQADGRGPGFVTKVAPRHPASRTQLATLLPFGSTERPFVAGGAKLPLLAPATEELLSVHRLPPAVFGRGYLEAIAESELERVSALAAARQGAIRGRPNRTKSGAIGRFGVKARLATLSEFTADALNGDMGITTPERPIEPAGPEGLTDDAKPGLDFDSTRVARLSDYVRLLEIPQRRTTDTDALALFERVGCALCHVPSLHTDPEFPVPALADLDAPIYSDLLLHDLGEALADGQQEEQARASEFRTAPLIGLRFLSALLHDGRAHSVVEAIEAHGAPDSEARECIEAYRALPAGDRTALIDFVESL